MRKPFRNRRSMNLYRRYRPASRTHLAYSPRVFPHRSDAYLKLSVEIPRPYLRCCARRDRGIRLARSSPHMVDLGNGEHPCRHVVSSTNINHLALVSECEPPLALHAQPGFDNTAEIWAYCVLYVLYYIIVFIIVFSGQ